MTGRERLLNLLNSKPVDRLAWTTLVDETTRSVMPDHVREMAPLDFYRHIGCDILQFGNYGLPASYCVVPPCQLRQPEHETETHTDVNGLLVQETRTEWGTLAATSKNGHPVRHAVGTLEELRILKNLWLNSWCEETTGPERSYERVEKLIGDDGIYVPTLSPSPVQQLIEIDTGPANFYYLLQDCPREMKELLAVMQERRSQEYEIVARRTPSAALILVENTSSLLISPSLYRQLSLPQIRDFVDITHKHGKKAVLHMCGHLRNLLPAIKDTRLDGINGLTPPPFGDTPFEHALDVLGEDLLILGGILDGSVFQRPMVSSAEIWQALDELYTPRMREASLLLWLPADGLPTPLERFMAVKEWMERRGCIRVWV